MLIWRGFPVRVGSGGGKTFLSTHWMTAEAQNPRELTPQSQLVWEAPTVCLL